MTGDEGGDDDVGYGKPPRHTRFAPGQSGNPGGRPQGPRSLAHDLREEMEEAVTLTEGESERTLSKQRSILRSLTARAAGGDARATAMVLDLVQRLFGAGAEPEPEGEPDFEEDEDPRVYLAARIEQISQRLRADRPDLFMDEDELEPEPEA